jgi:hypothetical protein
MDLAGFQGVVLAKLNMPRMVAFGSLCISSNWISSVLSAISGETDRAAVLLFFGLDISRSLLDL